MSQVPEISESELQKLVPTTQVEEWVQNLLKRFHINEEARQHLILRKRNVSEIVNELLPLSKYAKSKYNSDSVYLKFYPGSKQSFDAEFYDSNNNLLERVEVTMAIDGQQRRIQGEALIKYGHSPIYQTPEYKGNSSNRVLYESESTMISSDDWIQIQADLIQSVYENKHNNLSKYPNITLLIGVDISWAIDWECEMVIEKVNILPNSFKNIVCVNISGEQIWELN